MRQSVRGVLRDDYISYLGLRGLPESNLPLACVLEFVASGDHLGLPHVRLHASRPVVVIEIVFAWPGLGREMANAVLSYDYPLAQGCFFLIATIVITLNFILDLIYPLSTHGSRGRRKRPHEHDPPTASSHGLSRTGIAPPSFIGALSASSGHSCWLRCSPRSSSAATRSPITSFAGGGLARYQCRPRQFPFGTNVYGQDVFRQTLLGAQRTLVIGFVSGTIIMTVGTLIGVVSGYFGGLTDAVLMRITDFFYAIPVPALQPHLRAFFRNEPVLGLRRNRFDLLAHGARVVRSVVLSLRERQYVKAAKAAGAGPLWIMRYHISAGHCRHQRFSTACSARPGPSSRRPR